MRSSGPTSKRLVFEEVWKNTIRMQSYMVEDTVLIVRSPRKKRKVRGR